MTHLPVDASYITFPLGILAGQTNMIYIYIYILKMELKKKTKTNK